MTSRSGFVLVEASIATAILATAMVALVPTFLLSRKAEGVAGRIRVSSQLSSALLEEIRLRRWDDKTPIPAQAISAGTAALGIDSGESASDKRTFDDVDDFNGWVEKPPRDPLHQPLTAFTDYTRQVTVRYVNASLTSVTGPTDYKEVVVCTQCKSTPSLCLSTILTNR